MPQQTKFDTLFNGYIRRLRAFIDHYNTFNLGHDSVTIELNKDQRLVYTIPNGARLENGTYLDKTRLQQLSDMHEAILRIRQDYNDAMQAMSRQIQALRNVPYYKDKKLSLYEQLAPLHVNVVELFRIQLVAKINALVAIPITTAPITEPREPQIDGLLSLGRALMQGVGNALHEIAFGTVDEAWEAFNDRIHAFIRGKTKDIMAADVDPIQAFNDACNALHQQAEPPRTATPPPVDQKPRTADPVGSHASPQGGPEQPDRVATAKTSLRAYVRDDYDPETQREEPTDAADILRVAEPTRQFDQNAVRRLFNHF